MFAQQIRQHINKRINDLDSRVTSDLDSLRSEAESTNTAVMDNVKRQLAQHSKDLFSKLETKFKTLADAMYNRIDLLEKAESEATFRRKKEADDVQQKVTCTFQLSQEKLDSLLSATAMKAKPVLALEIATPPACMAASNITITTSTSSFSPGIPDPFATPCIPPSSTSKLTDTWDPAKLILKYPQDEESEEEITPSQVNQSQKRPKLERQDATMKNMVQSIMTGTGELMSSSGSSSSSSVPEGIDLNRKRVVVFQPLPDSTLGKIKGFGHGYSNPPNSFFPQEHHRWFLYWLSEHPSVKINSHTANECMSDSVKDGVLTWDIVNHHPKIKNMYMFVQQKLKNPKKGKRYADLVEHSVKV